MIGELNLILSKMFKKEIINANYQVKQLQGGTLGDVKLISGDAEHRLAKDYNTSWFLKHKINGIDMATLVHGVGNMTFTCQI